MGPFLELLVVSGIWLEQGGEGPDEAARLVISGQAAVSLLSSACRV
jgi:hypothetical protein